MKAFSREFTISDTLRNAELAGMDREYNGAAMTKPKKEVGSQVEQLYGDHELEEFGLIKQERSEPLVAGLDGRPVNFNDAAEEVFDPQESTNDEYEFTDEDDVAQEEILQQLESQKASKEDIQDFYDSFDNSHYDSTYLDEIIDEASGNDDDVAGALEHERLQIEAIKNDQAKQDRIERELYGRGLLNERKRGNQTPRYKTPNTTSIRRPRYQVQAEKLNSDEGFSPVGEDNVRFETRKQEKSYFNNVN